MLKQSASASPGQRPAVYDKKLSSPVRLGRDLAWLVGHLRDLVAIYGEEKLAPRLREAIMAGVAYENRCRWCAFMHSEWARKVGLSEEELREATELEPRALSPRERAVVEYARRRAAADFGGPTGARDEAFDDRLGPRLRELAETAARLMTTANLMANTFDALLSRLRGRPVAGSRLVDEVVVGGLFALGIPAGAAALSIMRRKNPLRLAVEFLSFSEAFDWRVEQRRLASVVSTDTGPATAGS
ncbi:MAG: carboxymuconolactone decarboxylase family protein [Persicimonas sp.]